MTKPRVLGSAVALAAVAFIIAVTSNTPISAQNRKDYSIASTASGHVALGLAIRKLNVAGTYLQAPAHPDDETNALFALYGYGMGMRVIDVQNNRGDGGQNEIGPELFRDIGVLRTAELLAAHRIDGAEQYFTRAIDYGYSFSPEEVIQKWGRERIVGDYVRFLREFRPDVMLTMNIQGGGGDRAHEATTILAREGYLAAGDPTKYPEQIKEGLRPWQPYKLYFAGAGPGSGRIGGAAPARPAAAPPAHLCRVDSSIYDTLLARTYADIAGDARSNHKCQGVGGTPAIPGFATGRGGRGGAPPAGGARGGGAAPTGPVPPGAAYTLMATVPSMAAEKDKDETSFFDGIDVSIEGLAKYAGANPPAALKTGLATIAEQAEQARQAFDYGNDERTAAPIEAGLTAIRALRSQLGSMGLSDSARYEIDFRLKNKEADYENAVIIAHGLTFFAVADDGLIVDGQPVRVQIAAQNRGATEISVSDVKVSGLANASPCAPGLAKKDGTYTCTSNGTVPANAKATDPYFTDNYWKHPSNPAAYDFDPSVPFGVPFAPTPFRVTFKVKAGSVEVTRDLPIEYRYVKDVYFGDKAMELNVVPAFSMAVTPELAIIPMSGTAGRPVTREIFVSVTNGAKGAAEASVALRLPAGWKATPDAVPIAFEKEDEALSARFIITAPVGAKRGDYTLKAVVTSKATGAMEYSTGYQAIEYPHIQRRQVINPAETSLKVMDVKTAPGLKVGYINGAGDQVPPAIEQLGAKLTFIDANELAWGDLSKYDVIMTGVRAYERRDDLRAYNRRVLDYVQRGGTMIVQYNKNEFNQAQFGPYPAQIGGSGVSGRVNDENVPVKLLSPNHPVFNFPNEIGATEWQDWTQERGQYFLGKKDPKYVDLVSMTDSFPDNPGEQLGGLVEAKYGKGRWLYVGLGLWRQLPAGTPGAYELLANLLSLPKAPAMPAGKK
jgi:LmbE family N-acetylglucosaminyl deacetylase